MSAAPGPLDREIARALSAVQFLTRLPVPDPGWEPGRMGFALAWFGAVGAAVGAIAAAVWLLAGLALAPAPAAGLALAAAIWVTGALHEDGLADTADGLGGHADRARALEIMRDSRIGSYGALALLLAVGLRWTALAGLAPIEGAVALVLAHAAARGLVVPAAVRVPPARGEGLAADLAAGRAPGREAAALLPAGLLALGLGAAGLLALVAGALAAGAVLLLLLRRLGGQTGDGLGAMAAAAETAVLLALAGALGGA